MRGGSVFLSSRYATRRLSENSTKNMVATLGRHVYTTAAGATVAATTTNTQTNGSTNSEQQQQQKQQPFVQANVSTAHFYFPAGKTPKPWGFNTFKMVSDGKILPLRSGGLLLLL